MYIDSHTHLYLEAFAGDRDQIIERALRAGVSKMLLPNIDSSSIEAMYGLAADYPEHCLPMMGLHPTSVKQDYKKELAAVEKHLDDPGIKAIGECGLDLYWDQSFLREQEEVFRIHIQWSLERDLPLVIHVRDSFPEVFRVMDASAEPGLRGVFHSFSGNEKELEKALSYGFMIGINGIVTFKNSTLRDLVAEIPAERILLETDAPYLTPHPHRGKRNESAFLPLIAATVADLHHLNLEEVARITSRNAENLFRLSSRHGQL